MSSTLLQRATSIKFIAFFFSLVVFPNIVNAQTPSTDVFSQYRPNVTKYSPNTAAFLKYRDVPISKYTGRASISIPIYTVETDYVSLPISLSYHGGGIKFEEEASWVGLGWSLNAGGQISQLVRAGDDITSQGYKNSPVPRLKLFELNPFK